MIQHLQISNYALIDKLDMSPIENLNTITGETGAGKSIMLGALGLILGNRADTKVLFDTSKKCVVEATFKLSKFNLSSLFEELDLDYEEETIIRREITEKGKSRAFINDVPVTLDILKTISSQLVDIHSQHQTLDISEKKFQLYIVDAYAGNSTILNEYKTIFNSYKSKKNELNDLEVKLEESQKELDYNIFLLEELTSAKLDEIDLEDLEGKLKIAENAENIKSTIYGVVESGKNSDQSVLSIIKELQFAITSVAKFSKELEVISDRFMNATSEIEDVFYDLESLQDSIEFNPAEVEELREKIDMIYSLQQKHKVLELNDLIILRDELEKKVNSVHSDESGINLLKNELDKLKQKLGQVAAKLSESRKDSLNGIYAEILNSLSNLGMPNSTLKIEMKEKEFSKDGVDDVDLLFSANKGVEPQPIKKAASGGEFSRFMFSVKYMLAKKTNLASIIFDEIDTGVSGEIAFKMGDMMREMAENLQVITITHLPQVAAKGNRHFFVYKFDKEEFTRTNIKELNAEEREFEIAKMISGDNPTEVAFQNAKELLSLLA